MVDESGGGDAGAGRQGAQLRLFGRVEWPINSLELVVLVFAHDPLSVRVSAAPVMAQPCVLRYPGSTEDFHVEDRDGQPVRRFS